MFKKAEVAMKGLLLAEMRMLKILVRAPKRKKKSTREKIFVFLENTQIIMSRMLLKTWMLKVFW